MIYIHVPFCHRKCTYCAFYSKVESGKWRVENYVDALVEEMCQRRGEQTHPIKTIYFGGGTPSVLSSNELERIIKALREYFDLSQLEEVTMECNPEDLTVDYLYEIRQLGMINRLSIGIQSFDDEVLRLLNRRHTAAQAIEAVENSRYAGFHNLSVDIIYGLPGMTSLTGLTSLTGRVTHISAYALTVEPGTALAVQVAQGRVELPEEEEVVSQYFAVKQQLEADGFKQYEISNYSRLGFDSKHNSRYWDRTPYLGLGPGAHSFDGIHRKWNNSNIEDYCKVLNDPKGIKDLEALCQKETLSTADAFNELLMTSLRTVRGLSLTQVPEQYKERLCRMIQPYVDCGWIVVRSEVGGMRYEPTEEGLLHADGIAADLFVS